MKNDNFLHKKHFQNHYEGILKQWSKGRWRETKTKIKLCIKKKSVFLIIVFSWISFGLIHNSDEMGKKSIDQWVIRIYFFPNKQNTAKTAKYRYSVPGQKAIILNDSTKITWKSIQMLPLSLRTVLWYVSINVTTEIQ